MTKPETGFRLRLEAQGLVGQIRARDRKGFALTFDAAVRAVTEALEKALNKDLDKEIGM